MSASWILDIPVRGIANQETGKVRLVMGLNAAPAGSQLVKDWGQVSTRLSRCATNLTPNLFVVNDFGSTWHTRSAAEWRSDPVQPFRGPTVGRALGNQPTLPAEPAS